MTTYDWVCLGLCIVGTVLCVCQYILHDCDLDDLMFKEDD